MEATYCLKFSITLIEKPGGKSKKHYNGRLWKINWWYVPCCVPMCTSDKRRKGDEILSFHSFSRDVMLRKKMDYCHTPRRRPPFQGNVRKQVT